jgi:hypothetical protein
MAKCEVCGNEYDKSFELIAAGARHTFDSFECAIQAIAPICEHCKCKVIGHGVEVGGRFFAARTARGPQHQLMLRIGQHRERRYQNCPGAEASACPNEGAVGALAYGRVG